MLPFDRLQSALRSVLALAFALLLGTHGAAGQAQPAGASGSARQQFLTRQKALGRAFANYFYPRYRQLCQLPPQAFAAKIDSARNQFTRNLARYASRLPAGYQRDQALEIRYYFDRLLLEYPANHQLHAGQPATLPAAVGQRLQRNLLDFNKPELLSNQDFTAYARSYLEIETRQELKKPAYAQADNRWLHATWQLLPALFADRRCREFWQQEYLLRHIDNVGVKGLEGLVRAFAASCRDTGYAGKVSRAYARDVAGRQGHLVRTYKTVGPFGLDLHLFLPPGRPAALRPAVVFFHGGSWSEGKPDWFFGTCQEYANRGWVACAVEYRILSRHGTQPFEAVLDAKSAVRWLRQHAAELRLDTARVVVSGNSAGGHLALATALVTKLNEATDNLRYSPQPNLLLLNAAAYDLTADNAAWVRNDPNQRQVEEISPTHLVRQGLPPMLMLHGTQDRNCPYATALAFRTKMEQAGNPVEFHGLEAAEHFIWFDPRFAGQVADLSAAFLKKHGY